MLTGLNFQYKNSKNPTLRNITLTISAGQKIAFIGESGSGKSTLLGILAGLFKDVGCEIKVDGRMSNMSAITSLCVLLPQEPEIFENTIAYNIGLGIPKAGKEIKKALVLSRFDEVLTRLGGSLKSEAKEKGLNISGDEKQRLALARGILAMKNSKLILLDEPTSSIDVNNENDIYDAIFTEFKNKTIISAVHHLNLVDKFDYIYVFADGCIVEHGTPAALKCRQGLFADMLKKYIYQSKV